MAKKKPTTKAEETKETPKPAAKPAAKKTGSAEDKLKKESSDYFKRFPNSNELYAVEGVGFFFKKQHAVNAAKGNKVYHFKRA